VPPHNHLHSNPRSTSHDDDAICPLPQWVERCSRREDLHIHIENRTLTVKGERRFEANEKEENFHRIERRFGSFIRTFTLPATVDTEHVSATSTDGVLSIGLAKKPESKPRRIDVQVGPAAAENKQVEASANA
jgi:HSP20 family protein